MRQALCTVLAILRVLLVLGDILGTVSEHIAGVLSSAKTDNIAYNIVPVDVFPNRTFQTGVGFWIIVGIRNNAVGCDDLLFHENEASTGPFTASET